MQFNVMFCIICKECSHHKYVVIIRILICQNIWLDTKTIFLCSLVQMVWYFKIAEHLAAILNVFYFRVFLVNWQLLKKKYILVSAILKFKMEALYVNGKTDTHFFLDPCNF